MIDHCSPGSRYAAVRPLRDLGAATTGEPTGAVCDLVACGLGLPSTELDSEGEPR